MMMMMMMMMMEGSVQWSAVQSLAEVRIQVAVWLAFRVELGKLTTRPPGRFYRIAQPISLRLLTETPEYQRVLCATYISLTNQSRNENKMAAPIIFERILAEVKCFSAIMPTLCREKGC